MPSLTYYLPTKIYFGQGYFKKLPEVLANNEKRIFFIVDRYFLKEGIEEKIKSLLSDKEIEIFGSISPNPSIEQVEKVIELLKDFKPEAVVAIGGGSALDTAKAASILYTQEGEIIDFLTKKRELKARQVKLIAMPTTAGTGSEVSPFATVWQGKEKYSLSGPLISPDIALVDPKLTQTMPPALTASTGIDALSQAVEAYWSIYSNVLSDLHAQEAIKLVFNNLETAAKQPNDLSARENMARAALEAGLAFSQTKTTAPHSVSYPMTAYFNVPHGLACGLTLPVFLEYNYRVTGNDCNDKRGASFVKNRLEQISKLIGATDVEQAAQKIKDLMQRIGLPTSLTKAGINDIEIIIKYGFNPQRVNNNPRLVTEKALRQLLKNI